jgi:hypothetical protein
MIGRRLIAGTAVVAAVAAGGVAGALIGIPGMSGAATSSSSSTSTTSPNESQSKGAPHVRGARGGRIFMGAGKDVLDAGAKTLNLSTEDLLAKLADGKTTIADVAEDEGVPVEDVIDAMAAVAKDDITDVVNNPLPAMPRFKDGPTGRGFGFGHRGGLRGGLGETAKALGITEQELLTELGKGQSVADIAKAKGVDIDTVIEALVAEASARIDAAVKADLLTQEKADKLKADLKERITERVNNTRPQGERHFGFPGGPGGPGEGFAPHADSQDATPDAA